MDSVESHIWDCLSNFSYEDALFSAERLHAEKKDSESLHILATTFYRIGRPKQAILVLSQKPVVYPKSQFLLAKCYYDLNYIEKAKQSLQVDGYNERIVKRIEKKFEKQCSYVFFLLGEIFRCLDRNKIAISYYRMALHHNSYLWVSFERICKLGENIDPSNIFTVTELIMENSLSAKENELEDRNTENINPNSQTPVVKDTNSKDLFDNDSKMITPEITGCKKINILPNPQPVQKNEMTFQSSFAETPLNNNFKGMPKSKRKTKKLSIIEKEADNDNDSWMMTQIKPKQVACSTPLNCIDKLSLSMSDVDSVKMTQQKKRSNRVSTCSNLLYDKLSKDEQSIIELDCAKESTSSNMIRSQNYLDLLIKFGHVYKCISDYDCETALEHLTKIPTKHLVTGRVLYWTAACFYHKSKYQYAKMYFDQISEKEPWQLIGMDMYSSVLWHLKQKEALGDLAEKLLKLDLNASEPWIAAGNYHSLKKKTILAIKFFQQALRNRPNDAYACTLLGHELLNKDSLEAAFSAFRHALRIDPRNYIAHFGMFKAHYHKDQLEQAEQHLVQAVLLFPKSSLLFTHLAILRERRGWYGFVAKNINDKKVYTKRLCKLNEETDKALVSGEAITYKGSALHCFNLGVSLDPTNNLAIYHRATLMLTRNYYQEAIEELVKLSKRLPNEAKIYMMLGNAYKQLHQYANAQINFARAVDLDPCSFNLSITASAYLDGVHTLSFISNDDGNVNGTTLQSGNPAAIIPGGNTNLDVTPNTQTSDNHQGSIDATPDNGSRTPFRRTRSPVGNSNILPNVQTSYVLRNPEQNNQGYSIIYTPPIQRRDTPEIPNEPNNSSRMNEEILSQIDNVNHRSFGNNQGGATEEPDDEFSDGYSYSFFPDDTMDLDE